MIWGYPHFWKHPSFVYHSPSTQELTQSPSCFVKTSPNLLCSGHLLMHHHLGSSLSVPQALVGKDLGLILSTADGLSWGPIHSFFKLNFTYLLFFTYSAVFGSAKSAGYENNCSNAICFTKLSIWQAALSAPQARLFNPRAADCSWGWLRRRLLVLRKACCRWPWPLKFTKRSVLD